ncbi:MAG: CDP-alcohol phosphatidyltransferase family protein [Pseudohongiella sp.]|nr:CDP-alcohol phosphatidyltransferase family protein [Pseudohongiella sp.]
MANLLTAIRLLLVMPVAWGFADSGFLSPRVLSSLIVLAIASDYFDGIVARATNTASAKGMLFDHATDFLFVSAGLAGLAAAGLIQPLLPALIVIAFAQYVLDSYYLFKQKQLRMSFLGRWNGVFYFLPLVLIAASRLEFLSTLEPLLQLIAISTGYALILSTVASIIDRAIAPLRGN